jgi:hypothetical protein
MAIPKRRARCCPRKLRQPGVVGRACEKTLTAKVRSTTQLAKSMAEFLNGIDPILVRESFCGNRFSDTNHSTFLNWFSYNTFGGTHYSNTCVGAVANTDEPGLGGVNNEEDYLLLWAGNKNFAISAWGSRGLGGLNLIPLTAPFMEVIGDPLTVK